MPPPLLPSNLVAPAGSHRPRPAGRPTPVKRHRAANFSHGRRATSGCGCASRRPWRSTRSTCGIVRHSEHAHPAKVRHGGRAATGGRAWRTAEQLDVAARAQRERERLPCLLPMQATAGRTLTLLAFTPVQYPSWPCRRVALSGLTGRWLVNRHDDLTVHPLGR